MVNMGREKILVIDDDTGFLGQAYHWLKNAGYEVIAAENGTSGLRRLYSGRPDLFCWITACRKWMDGRSAAEFGT